MTAGGAAGIGVGVALFALALILGVGMLVNRQSSVPWSCDDTRYNATTPTGRGVVGPSVSAPPGCS